LSGAKISVFIITKNEEANIAKCLESVKWADEIVIADSFSSDKTPDICRNYTDKVYQREFSDFADMKNFALSKVSNEWALSIDADEECAPVLKDEITQTLAMPGIKADGFFIKRRSHIFGRWFKFTGTQNDFQMRLFRAAKARYFQPIHEKVNIDGETSYLKESLLHYTYNSVSDYMIRLKRYTDVEAKFLKSKGERLVFLKIFVMPPLRFISLYFIKQGFRDGVSGFLFSIFSGFYDFMKYAKLTKLIIKDKISK